MEVLLKFQLIPIRLNYRVILSALLKFKVSGDQRLDRKTYWTNIRTLQNELHFQGHMPDTIREYFDR